MALSPPISAKQQVIYFTDVGGTERNLTCAMTGVEMAGESAAEQIETFCAVEKITGRNSWRITGRGRYDGGVGKIDEVMFNLKKDTNTARLVRYFPEGEAVASPRYMGSGIVTNYSIAGEGAGAVLVNFSFEINGDPDRALVS